MPGRYIDPIMIFFPLVRDTSIKTDSKIRSTKIENLDRILNERFSLIYMPTPPPLAERRKLVMRG